MKSTLQEMVRQIRGFTCQMLEMTNPDWVTWAPEATSNHMLWHAGHSIWVQDLLCIQKLTGKSEIDDEWSKKFGQHCEPVSTQTEWPSLDEIKHSLVTQQSRLHDVIEAMTAEQLTINSENDQDLVGGIINGLHDEAKHHGEMYLLHKLSIANSGA